MVLIQVMGRVYHVELVSLGYCTGENLGEVVLIQTMVGYNWADTYKLHVHRLAQLAKVGLGYANLK